MEFARWDGKESSLPIAVFTKAAGGAADGADATESYPLAVVRECYWHHIKAMDDIADNALLKKTVPLTWPQAKAAMNAGNFDIG